MEKMEQVLKTLTLDYFGSGCHKITPSGLLGMKRAVFVDVRSREEEETLSIRLNHHKGIIFKHIPLNELPDRLDEIPRDILIGLFCPANVRSTIAMVYLLYKGYQKVRVIEGGYAALTEEMKPGKVLKLVQQNS